MKRQAFFFVMLAVLTFVSNGFSESGGIVDSAINVIAKNGIFTVGGSGKEPFTPQACASSEVFNFLDSAGASYIEKIFPDFDPADTLSVNQEGEAVLAMRQTQNYWRSA